MEPSFRSVFSLIYGRVAALGHHGIEHGSGVAFGEDEAVALRPLGVGGVVPHDVEEERDQDLDRGKRSAGMAGFGGPDHFDDVTASLLGDRLQFCCVRGLLHS